jgi:hypothetical protein
VNLFDVLLFCVTRVEEEADIVAGWIGWQATRASASAVSTAINMRGLTYCMFTMPFLRAPILLHLLDKKPQP